MAKGLARVEKGGTFVTYVAGSSPTPDKVKLGNLSGEG